MIRQDNFSKVIKVSQKQNKMTRLIRRKKNIEAVLQLTAKIKYNNSNLDNISNSNHCKVN